MLLARDVLAPEDSMVRLGGRGGKRLWGMAALGWTGLEVFRAPCCLRVTGSRQKTTWCVRVCCCGFREGNWLGGFFLK